MNVGGNLASGDIVTFCHADTTLPYGWDVLVCDNIDRGKADALAFMFQMSNVDEIVGGRGVTRCVNLRCRWFNLPYGDQTLSLRR